MAAPCRPRSSPCLTSTSRPQSLSGCIPPITCSQQQLQSPAPACPSLVLRAISRSHSFLLTSLPLFLPIPRGALPLLPQAAPLPPPCLTLVSLSPSVHQAGQLGTRLWSVQVCGLGCLGPVASASTLLIVPAFLSLSLSLHVPFPASVPLSLSWSPCFLPVSISPRLSPCPSVCPCPASVPLSLPLPLSLSLPLSCPCLYPCPCLHPPCLQRDRWAASPL